MRISIPLTPVLLAAVTAVAFAGPALAASHGVSVKTFVLTRADVPATFNAKIDYVRDISLTDALSRYGLKQKMLIKAGRVDGFESGFSRPYSGKSTPKGFYGVADDVTQFATTAGARWFYERMKKGVYTGTPADVPAIGDERVARDSPVLKGGQSRTAAITFRHGKFVVDVTTSFLGDGDPLPKAIKYAQIIDHRLTAHSM